MRPNDVLREGDCPGWVDGWMKWFGLEAKIAITFKRKFAFYMNLLWCSSPFPPPLSDRDEKLIHHQPQGAASDTGRRFRLRSLSPAEFTCPFPSLSPTPSNHRILSISVPNIIIYFVFRLVRTEPRRKTGRGGDGGTEINGRINQAAAGTAIHY